jgi:hypothetical protein
MSETVRTPEEHLARFAVGRRSSVTRSGSSGRCLQQADS